MTHIKEDDMVLVGWIECVRDNDFRTQVYIDRIFSFRSACRDLRHFTYSESRCYSDMISSVSLKW